MTDANPFASPTTDAARGRDKDSSPCTRRGKFLITRGGGDLPARCVVCNTDEELVTKSYRLAYYPPIIYLGLVFGLFPVLILAMLLQRTTTIRASVCDEHRPRWTTRLYIFLGSVLLGAGMIALGGQLNNEATGYLLGGGIIVVVIGFFIAMLSGSLISAKKITRDGEVWVAGCREAFLDTFPAAPPPL
jgi:hypothetical protein